MPKKAKPVKRPSSKLDWLLAERQRSEVALELRVDELICAAAGKTSRNPSPCDIATAVFLAASEYETAAAAVLIAANEVYTYANAVRIAAMEEMSMQCSPNG